jgi:hypothetical protein
MILIPSFPRKRESSAFIQDAFMSLSPAMREDFLLTGFPLARE